MSNELTDVRCPCGAEFQADSYDAGFIAGSGMCQNCDAALPPKDICTCPSGNGSLRHPCPAHPASVEQAGGDERAAFELFVRKHCGMPAHIAVNWDAKFTNDAWAGWQARAALAQPSPAQAEQAEPERPEVVAWQYRVTAGPQTGWSLWHPGKGEEFERSYTVERRPLMTVAQHERIVKAWIERWKAYIELSAKIAAQRDAANARLHEVATACATAEQERDAALARVAELERKLRNEENAHTTTIEQRDNAEHWADQLANAIAERFGVDIGEHSNLNCPWNEALVWMQQPPAQAQHSMPGEFIGRLSEFLAQRGATGKALLRELRTVLAAAPGKEGV
ncbi:hypothetical protein ACIUY8_09635 [Pseudomonas aeruginosa]